MKLRKSKYHEKSCFFSIEFFVDLLQYCYTSKLVSTPTNVGDVQKWVKENFAKGKIPPFSFVYDGKSSDSFLKSWHKSEKLIAKEEPGSEETLITYKDKKTGLMVKCHITVFSDFPAVEWCLIFPILRG
ncbi:MAG: hypothetical protein R2757_18045 [Draconibacterium sp.]